jgi:hypothetical protein
MLRFLFLLILTTNAWSFDHDHKYFQEVLDNFVTRTGSQTLVNYSKVQKSPEKLNQYIKDLSEVSKRDFNSWSHDQKLVTLINGYNAWTLKLIIDHYPVSSIKDIGSFLSDAWEQEFIKWLDKIVTLNHIEHDLIRKNFNEPRIHFALVCAAVGCPSLQEKVYLASSLDTQLQKASDEFLQDKKKYYSKTSNDEVTLYVSSIFKWYGKDFGSEKELKSYLAGGMRVPEDRKISLKFLDYDWSLNDSK